jgi:3-hydroxybutyryl-CoA dehydrogenase
MKIKKIGVIGAGTMGNGIAQVASQAGYEVVMRDIEEGFVKKGLGAITKNLQRSVDKERITEQQKEEILSRIKGTTDMGEMKNVDLIIEAIIENAEESIQGIG